MKIILIPNREELIDFQSESVGFFFVVEPLLFGLLESLLMNADVSRWTGQLADRLPRKIGHVREAFVIEQRGLVLFAQAKSLGVLDELFLCL